MINNIKTTLTIDGVEIPYDFEELVELKGVLKQLKKDESDLMFRYNGILICVPSHKIPAMYRDISEIIRSQLVDPRVKWGVK